MGVTYLTSLASFLHVSGIALFPGHAFPLPVFDRLQLRPFTTRQFINACSILQVIKTGSGNMAWKWSRISVELHNFVQVTQAWFTYARPCFIMVISSLPEAQLREWKQRTLFYWSTVPTLKNCLVPTFQPPTMAFLRVNMKMKYSGCLSGMVGSVVSSGTLTPDLVDSCSEHSQCMHTLLV